MRMHDRFRRHRFAVGLVGIIALIGLDPGHAGGAGPQDDPARQEDPGVPARAGVVELSAQVVRRSKAATALVEVRSIGSGSGVCVSADGFFITNNHVVEGAGLGEDVKLVIAPGQKDQRVLSARVVKLDEGHDLALLKADAVPGLTTLPLGRDDHLYETMPLAAFGFPFGRMLAADRGAYPAISVNTGTVTALRRKEGRLDRIQLDASVNPGNSGGPVVDGRGNLIGIVVSGILMARVNFAIPVSHVREFLDGPALVLRKPRLTFSGRTQSRRFEIDAYAMNPRILGEIAVELALTDSISDTRTLKARRVGNRFVAEGPPFAPGGPALKSTLVVHKGRARIRTDLPSGVFSLGGRTFAWSSVDSLAKDGDEWVVSLTDGGRFAGKPSGLPGVRYGDGRTTALATADRIDVRLDGKISTEVGYEIQSRRGSKTYAPIQGRLEIHDMPGSLTPGFDRPVVRTEVRQPVVIEATVPGTLTLMSAPSGLGWVPRPGAPAGMEDERGRYLLVNGEHWYFEQMKHRLENVGNAPVASLWRILFGIRESQIRLLWARPEGGGAHDAGRVSVEVARNGDLNINSITIKNLAPQPTRVAVAVSFDPSRTVVPIPTPRTGPVLESHWPLDDRDPLVAADLGPGKHNGRSSAARTVHGVRGDAVRVDRQPVVCPGVLAVDRGDRFTCTAWINPNPVGGGTILGRMNVGLRGFDLDYNGTLSAHLISSWDGNAIRVSTIERFEPLEWHHVAVSYDGSSLSSGLRIYIDGAPATLEVTHDRLSETIRSDFPFAIGGRERRDLYQGRIDEVRAYDRVLSADEVFELYDLERSNLDPPAGSTLKRGLVGHWSFDGPTVEVFEDRSGGGHPGRLVPDEGLPEIVQVDGGQTLRLGGQGAVDCGAVGDFERDEPFSVGAWFKTHPGGYKTLMAALDRENRGYDILLADGHIYGQLISEWEGSALQIDSRPTYHDEEWHHAVVTYDGSSRGAGMKLYLDGVEAPCDVSHDSLTTTTKSHATFRIGSRSDRHYFNGEIDEAFVYRRALPAGEARAWFDRGRNSARPLPAELTRDLLGYWPFEGKGAEAYRDRSGHGHDGQPDLYSAHAAIVPQGPTRVARFRSNGGIDCGQAGDFDRTDAFSAGGWFCWEGGPTESLFSKIHHGGSGRGFEIAYDGEKYLAQLTHNWEGPENALVIQSPPIRGTGWRHVMFTYDGTSRAPGFKLYVDGQLQKANVLKDNLSRTIRVEEPFVIGSRLVASTLFGRAAHVRLIPRELTAEDVRRLAQADRPAGPLP